MRVMGPSDCTYVIYVHCVNFNFNLRPAAGAHRLGYEVYCIVYVLHANGLNEHAK